MRTFEQRPEEMKRTWKRLERASRAERRADAKSLRGVGPKCLRNSKMVNRPLSRER